jgi:hypothetical protein
MDLFRYLTTLSEKKGLKPNVRMGVGEALRSEFHCYCPASRLTVDKYARKRTKRELARLLRRFGKGEGKKN